MEYLIGLETSDRPGRGCVLPPTMTRLERTDLLDMWVIFMDISPGKDPVVPEERKASVCRALLHV